MGPIEIIYNGYIKERKGIDTAETNEAADNLMGMIESLLPNSDKMQDILYMECLHLGELSKKQGFIAGFAFALELFRGKRMGEVKVDNRDIGKGKQGTGRRRHYAYLGPGAEEGKEVE